VPPPFSSRTAWDLAETPYAAAIRRRRAAGKPILDLTLSNPTLCGFNYDAASILSPLSAPATLQYQPDPFGLPSARAAVSAYYADHGAVIPPENILLTSSTSESYSYLFRLLCNPGDCVLVPRPGYPLFDYLAALDHVELRTYDMHPANGWMIDFASLTAHISAQSARFSAIPHAIVLVSPNNPTGNSPQPDEIKQLISICEAHNIALIVDEVFLDYLIPSDLQPKSRQTFAAIQSSAPIFILSGISKIAALPQMKLGWIAINSPDPFRSQAIERLEVIADTFLSVNLPAQHALPTWLANRGQIQAQILTRIQQNLSTLHTIHQAHPLLEFLPPDAGWNAVLKLPNNFKQSDFAVNLLETKGVLVHPGAFYGFPDSNWLVVSTITPTNSFQRGISLLADYIEEESN
jgi:aspartate/methionine/tyrosine aminotransferase